MKITPLFPLATLALALGTAVGASAATLYDGALASLPSAQGWSYLTDPLPPPFGAGVLATRSLAGGGAVLDTTPRQSDSAGYFSLAGDRPALPVLDRTAGFTLGFSLQIQDENHAVSNRAGFSVLVVTDDLKALELAFWENQVWAYADGATGGLFAHGETGFLDTTVAAIDYTLDIQGNGYHLAANGTPLLSGTLRDYTAFSGFPDPYETPNLIFMGDDTSSAAARSLLTRVSLSPLPIPAPPVLALFLAGLGLLRGFLRPPA
jgi:hypothetical protein